MVIFKDKKYWALILGGSSGLGYATALKLAKHGMHICIVHRDARANLPIIAERIAQIKSYGVEVMTFNKNAFKSDIRTEILEEISHKLSAGGTIKTLVHSVAKGNLKPMQHSEKPVLTHDDFQLTIDAMAISLYDWTRAVFDAKLFDKDARIISFTSEGNQKAWPNYAAISAAKVALEAISRNIALEFAPFGIKANCLQAGVTDTTSLSAIPGSDLIKKYSVKRNPYGRLTLPEDVANAVFLLVLDEAKWINGCIIPVDGGSHIN